MIIVAEVWARNIFWCEKFAQKLGVSLRVEVCKDTAEMVKRLLAGDADLIAFPLPKKLAQKKQAYCLWRRC